ncbi:10304_t:CDS:2 [Entrophospora sp. SA101]|nr:10304_t:CDS:2 [Entrophospora sp. SA101]
MQLCDVFEAFQDTAMEYYELDPVYYISTAHIPEMQYANNLYGWAMSQFLPYGGFKWIRPSEAPDLMSIPENSPKGYTYVVDLKYPKHLHNLHNDYPLAPENIEKLCPNLMDKKEYAVHYKTLQYYVKMGMEITKIHMILEFDQSPWLSPFINFNTEMRKKAKNEFEKDFFKLMNNLIYGKTMENLQNYNNIKLIKLKDDWQSEQAVIKNIGKPRCKDFHAEYGEKANLLYTDTDSLTYEVETEDIYVNMSKNAELFDFSNCPKEHPLYNTENKAVIGKFKDECSGTPMQEFIGLRAFEIDNGKVIRDPTKKVLCPLDTKKWILDDGINSYAYGHYKIQESYIKKQEAGLAEYMDLLLS